MEFLWYFYGIFYVLFSAAETECEIIDSQKNDWFDCIVAPQPDPASWPDNYAGNFQLFFLFKLSTC